MRRPPASSHRSRVYDPPYYAPGGFCLPVQSPAPDYDVIPDLSARTDTLPPRKSPSGLAVVLRAGYSLIATVIAVARKSRTERATVSRHAGPPLTRNGPLAESQGGRRYAVIEASATEPKVFRRPLPTRDATFFSRARPDVTEHD